MTEILLIWLNTEVDLSKKIKSLEDDFANGFYLGELLYRFNQLTNFHEFRNKDDRDSKLNNFNILQKVLSNIRVKFDSNKAKEIMDKKRGAISLLLYQIRTRLEKKGISMENLSLKKSSHINELYQSKILGPKIEKYDKLNEKFFNERLAKLIPAQKDVEMKKVLQRFEEERKKYDEYLANNRLNEMIHKKTERDRKIEIEKSKAQRVHAFNQMFEQKGIENWKKNEIKKKKMEEKDLEFQLKEAEKFQKIVFDAIKKSENEVIKQIEKFENLLLGNDAEEANDHLKNNKQYSTSLKVKDSAAEKVNQILEKIMKNPLAKKERDRRRRKIIVEQSKAQLEIENMRKENQLISKLFKQSNQEKQLAFESYRVKMSKEIIIKDRFLREEMYSIKNEMDVRFNEENQKEFLNLHRDKLDMMLTKEEIRRKTLSVSLKQNQRSKNTDYCKKLVDMIIEITEDAYDYQQVNDKEEFDERVWREWTQLFINNMSVRQTEAEKERDRERERDGESPTKTKEMFFHGGEINHVVDGNNIHGDNMSGFDHKHDNLNNRKELPANLMEITEKVDKIDKVEEFNNSLIPSANQTNFGTGFAALPYTDVDKKLDDCELLDYVNYLCQWSYKNISENNFLIINLAELMLPELSDDPKSKDNKNKDIKKNVVAKTGKKDDEEFKEDNPYNLEIPRQPVRNELFGNLIDTLIDIKFIEEQNILNEQENEKNKYNFIPIKLILNGQPFSGKKMQAKYLAEKYSLKIFTIEDLIKMALEEAEKPDEFEEVEVRNDNLEDLRENEKEYDDEDITKVKKENALKEIGMQIKEYLKNGDAISDKLYVHLVDEVIKMNFVHKNKEDLVTEAINRHNKRNELLERKEFIKDEKEKRPKYYEAVINEIEEEMRKLTNETIYGFCIMNFPHTYNQAKLLERTLSGYIPENEKAKTQAEIYKEETALILDKTPKPEPPKKLIQSGVDYFFLVNTDPAECARRAFGRKVDPLTGVVYHLQDNPPPIDNYICERLQEVIQNDNSQASFVTRCVSFENTLPLLKEFYQPFGFEKEKLSTWVEVNGNKDADRVSTEIDYHIKKLISIKEKAEEEMIEANESPEIDLVDEDDVNVSGDKNLADATANEILEVKKNLEQGELTKYYDKLEWIKKQLSPDLIDLLLKIWFRMYENYIKECKSIFKFIRRQREFIAGNYNNLCQKFIDFLKRPSKKQLHLLDYQIQYNKFLDDYSDLKDDPRVKEEHHQRVDDLADKIFEIIEIRKAEAVDQRKKIMTSNWIENEMEKFFHNLERLFQIEIDKFLGSLQIIKDYYHGLDNRVLAEIPFYTIDIIKDEIDPVPIEKEIANPLQAQGQGTQANNTANNKNNKIDNNPNVNIFGFEEEFPRVEKLYRTALRVQYQYDEMLFKAEKERIKQLMEKDAKDKKNKPKIDSKNKNQSIEPVIEEKKPEDYPHDKEMNEALVKEKAKYRCRITLLKNWGVKYVKNLRKQANEIYSKLEDWIILAIKAENEALNQLCTVLKKHIEDEQKIKYELELDTFDVKINMDVVNYIEEPPKLLPAKEVIDQNKFNIQQLNILIGELSTYIVANNNIRTSNFLKIFEKKYITSKTHNDVYYGLPNCLKKLTFHNFYKFVKCFDPENTDFMNLQHVLTLFCILQSPVCTEENETELKNHCGPYLRDFVKLDKENFIKTPMWFDSYETCITPQGYEVYDRVEKLKEIIFEINKDEDELIDLFELCNLLTLRKLSMYDPKNEGRTYYEVLFF